MALEQIGQAAQVEEHAKEVRNTTYASRVTFPIHSYNVWVERKSELARLHDLSTGT